MTPDELDVHLDELDNRLERLRALYEQYFLGIEKMPPAVARKDVDRRFWMMRKIQIRNTARRFRLQVLVQRYNTFQQYWARICREIENGTYARHLVKVEKRFGEELLTATAKKRGRRRAPTNPAAPDDTVARAAAADDLDQLLGAGVDLAAEAQRAVAAASHVAARPSPPPRDDLDDLALDFDALDGPASVRAPAPGRTAPQIKAEPAPRAELPPQQARLQGAPAATAGDRAARPPLPRPAGSMPLPSSATGEGGAKRPALPRPVSAPQAERPLAERPSPKIPPVAPKPPPAGGPSLKAGVIAGAVSDDRVKQLHAELTAAKKQLNQDAGVSVDGLAKSLRATVDRLQTKHEGRRIDFQVVVKDGQAVLQPVVRK